MFRYYQSHLWPPASNDGTKIGSSESVISANERLRKDAESHTGLVGERVRRGPDWKWNNQGGDMEGTICSSLEDGDFFCFF